MKDFKKSHDIAGQSNKVQNTHKHDVNLQKNSSLYFQIGVILCLLAAYGIFELKFEDKQIDKAILKPLGPEDTTFVLPNFVVVPDEQPKPIHKAKQKVITQVIEIVPNNQTIPDFVDIVTTSEAPKVINLKSFKEPVEPEPDSPTIFNMVNVEVVPIYPGCENKTTNKERLKCMSEKLGRLVQKTFDTNLALREGLSGIQKIDVQFKIDQHGEVTEIITRAPHPSLEKEAKRVAEKIPVMTPGLQRQKAVSVIYNLPIVFHVRN